MDDADLARPAPADAAAQSAAGMGGSVGEGGMGGSSGEGGMGGSIGGGGMGAAGVAPARGGAGAPASRAGSGAAAPVSCPDGLRACPNGQCQSTVDHPDHCGTACTVCKYDSICKAGVCVACATASEHRCSSLNECFAKTDPMHCGTLCIACPSVPYGTSTCEDGGCKVVCKSDALTCTGQPAACARASWDFEDNTMQGWTLAEGSTADAYVMSTRTHAGRYALAASVRVNRPETEGWVTLVASLCQASTAPDLAGKTISAWFYFDGPALAENCCEITPYVFVMSPAGTTSFSPNIKAMKPIDQARIGQWFKVSGTMPSNSPQTVNRLDLRVSLYVDSWVGTMYVDDIKIE